MAVENCFLHGLPTCEGGNIDCKLHPSSETSHLVSYGSTTGIPDILAGSDIDLVIALPPAPPVDDTSSSSALCISRHVHHASSPSQLRYRRPKPFPPNNQIIWRGLAMLWAHRRTYFSSVLCTISRGLWPLGVCRHSLGNELSKPLKPFK